MKAELLGEPQQLVFNHFALPSKCPTQKPLLVTVSNPYRPDSSNYPVLIPTQVWLNLMSLCFPDSEETLGSSKFVDFSYEGKYGWGRHHGSERYDKERMEGSNATTGKCEPRKTHKWTVEKISTTFILFVFIWLFSFCSFLCLQKRVFC